MEKYPWKFTKDAALLWKKPDCSWKKPDPLLHGGVMTFCLSIFLKTQRLLFSLPRPKLHTLLVLRWKELQIIFFPKQIYFCCLLIPNSKPKEITFSLVVMTVMESAPPPYLKRLIRKYLIKDSFLTMTFPLHIIRVHWWLRILMVSHRKKNLLSARYSLGQLYLLIGSVLTLFPPLLCLFPPFLLTQMLEYSSVACVFPQDLRLVCLP